jgi:hypothetical protein
MKRGVHVTSNKQAMLDILAFLGLARIVIILRHWIKTPIIQDLPTNKIFFHLSRPRTYQRIDIHYSINMASGSRDGEEGGNLGSCESEVERNADSVRAKADDTKQDEDEVESEEEGEAQEDEVDTSSKAGKSAGQHDATDIPSHQDGTIDGPPLPDEDIPPLPTESVPPLPTEAVPGTEEDDGWAPVWDEGSQAFYFVNRFTGASQWTNPRVPEASAAVVAGPPGVAIPSEPVAPISSPPAATVITGYNPAIHGDYDSTAWYAQPAPSALPESSSSSDPAAAYQATAAFNRFTGRFQNSEITPENYNDENKSKRQMNAFFDVDAAANSHDGRSLKEERSNKKISKQELKQFKEKRKAKKEEKRRAWLRD